MLFRHGQEGKIQGPRAATAAATAGDADGRAARGRDDQPLPAPLLALARPRSWAGCRRGRPDADTRLVEAPVRAYGSRVADDGCVPGCGRHRDRASAGEEPALRRSRGRLRRLRPGALPIQPVRASRRCLARALRALGAGRGDREMRLSRGAEARLSARAGRLHPRRRVARDTRDRRVSHRHCPLLPAARRERARAHSGSLPVLARHLAHTVPRRRPALLRSGGEGPDEEERCPPTSCSRP
jgi:hypothetical protein